MAVAPRLIASGDSLFDALLMAGVLLASEIIGALAGWVRAVQTELVQNHLNNLIHSKALPLELAFYEAPDSYDSLHRSKVNAINPCRRLARKHWPPLPERGDGHGRRLAHLWLVAAGCAASNARPKHNGGLYDWLIVNGEAVAEWRTFHIGDY